MNNHQTIMRAEVKADCYAGDNCEEVRNYFSVYCDGDKEGSEGTEDLLIKCAELPPGTVVEVRYPCCPDCGIPRQDKFEMVDGHHKHIGHAAACECGLDWTDWVLNRFA